MSYAYTGDHREMVADSRRNSAYRHAMQKLVRADSVVLDLGAGLGILGMLAAAAGAARVYLVEPSPVARLARELVRENGFADRVQILEGRIEELELPEPVDLILSVFTGNLLFSEDLLPSLFHARDRWLKPGGQLLPDVAELCCVPVMHPELHAKYIGCWSELQLGVDNSAARRFAANEIIWPERSAGTGKRLGESMCLARVDLTQATVADCDAVCQASIAECGECHGLLCWIRMRLGDSWLSTDPDLPPLHWQNAVLPLDPPLPVQAGEQLELRLKRPAGGDWSWTVSGPGGVRRHSTFLARLDNRERLERWMGSAVQDQGGVSGQLP